MLAVQVGAASTARLHALRERQKSGQVKRTNDHKVAAGDNVEGEHVADMAALVGELPGAIL